MKQARPKRRIPPTLYAMPQSSAVRKLYHLKKSLLFTLLAALLFAFLGSVLYRRISNLRMYGESVESYAQAKMSPPTTVEDLPDAVGSLSLAALLHNRSVCTGERQAAAPCSRIGAPSATVPFAELKARSAGLCAGTRDCRERAFHALVARPETLGILSDPDVVRAETSRLNFLYLDYLTHSARYELGRERHVLRTHHLAFHSIFVPSLQGYHITAYSRSGVLFVLRSDLRTYGPLRRALLQLVP